MLPMDKTGELIHAAPGFQLVISYNPGYQHAIKDLKPSTRQRFVALEFDFPPAEREAEIVAHEGGVDRADAARAGGAGRAACAACATRGWPSRPARGCSSATARLMAGGIPAEQACRVALVEPAHGRSRPAGGDRRPDRGHAVDGRCRSPPRPAGCGARSCAARPRRSAPRCAWTTCAAGWRSCSPPSTAARSPSSPPRRRAAGRDRPRLLAERGHLRRADPLAASDGERMHLRRALDAAEGAAAALARYRLLALGAGGAAGARHAPSRWRPGRGRTIRSARDLYLLLESAAADAAIAARRARRAPRRCRRSAPRALAARPPLGRADAGRSARWSRCVRRLLAADRRRGAAGAGARRARPRSRWQRARALADGCAGRAAGTAACPAVARVGRCCAPAARRTGACDRRPAAAEPRGEHAPAGGGGRGHGRDGTIAASRQPGAPLMEDPCGKPQATRDRDAPADPDAPPASRSAGGAPAGGGRASAAAADRRAARGRAAARRGRAAGAPPAEACRIPSGTARRVALPCRAPPGCAPCPAAEGRRARGRRRCWRAHAAAGAPAARALRAAARPAHAADAPARRRRAGRGRLRARLADRRTGHSIDDRLYAAVRPARRGLAITLLVDISGSHRARSWATTRIIDIEKDGAAAHQRGAGRAGRPVLHPHLQRHRRGATCGCAPSRTSASATARRCGSASPRCEPEGYTRLGAAVRHATALLARQHGRPPAAADPLRRQAQRPGPLPGPLRRGGFAAGHRRGARRGVYPFCLTVDRKGGGVPDAHLRRAGPRGPAPPRPAPPGPRRRRPPDPLEPLARLRMDLESFLTVLSF